MKLRKPRAIRRVVSMTPLIASVGPLLVPGRSKNASTSGARCLSVRPRRRISVSAAGTPLVMASMTACIISFPLVLLGSQ